MRRSFLRIRQRILIRLAGQRDHALSVLVILRVIREVPVVIEAVSRTVRAVDLQALDRTGVAQRRIASEAAKHTVVRDRTVDGHGLRIVLVIGQRQIPVAVAAQAPCSGRQVVLMLCLLQIEQLITFCTQHAFIAVRDIIRTTIAAVAQIEIRCRSAASTKVAVVVGQEQTVVARFLHAAPFDRPLCLVGQPDGLFHGEVLTALIAKTSRCVVRRSVLRIRQRILIRLAGQRDLALIVHAILRVIREVPVVIEAVSRFFRVRVRVRAAGLLAERVGLCDAARFDRQLQLLIRHLGRVDPAAAVHHAADRAAACVCQCHGDATAAAGRADGQRPRNDLRLAGILFYVVLVNDAHVFFDLDRSAILILRISVMADQLDTCNVRLIDKCIIHVVRRIQTEDIITGLVVMDVVRAHRRRGVGQRAELVGLCREADVARFMPLIRQDGRHVDVRVPVGQILLRHAHTAVFKRLIAADVVPRAAGEDRAVAVAVFNASRVQRLDELPVHGKVGLLILVCSRVILDSFAVRQECICLALQPVITGMCDLVVAVRLNRSNTGFHSISRTRCLGRYRLAVIARPCADRITRYAFVNDDGLLARQCIPFRSQRRVPAYASTARALVRFLICNLFRQIDQRRAIPPIGIALGRSDRRYIKIPVNTGRIGLSSHQNDVQLGRFNLDGVCSSASGEGCTADFLRVKLAVNDFQHIFISNACYFPVCFRRNIIIILHCDVCRSSRLRIVGQNDRRQKRESHAETQKQGYHSLLQFAFLQN